MAFLSTHDLVGRASKILADPDMTPYPVGISSSLAAAMNTMLETAWRQGSPPPGFDKFRAVAVAVIDDCNAKQPAA